MYHDPKTVLSPKDRVKSVQVIYDEGDVRGSWSVAEIDWDDPDDPNGTGTRIGIRYNGDVVSHKGLPQARGNPAWFIVPQKLEAAVMAAARDIRNAKAASLVDGYRMMAEDREREVEAEEWIEGLIGDAD